MEISAILDGLRHHFPACQNVAYTDLATGLILATSAAADVSQEHWDDLAQTAVALLNGEMADHLADILAPEGVGCAILSAGSDLDIFVRSAVNPDDALCCVGTMSIDINALLGHMQDCLKKIDGDA